MSRGRATAAVLAASLAVGAAGCARLGGTESGAARLHPWTTPGTVRIGFYEEPDTLNPVITSMSFATDVFSLVYDGLVRFDATGHAVPDLAREVPTLANGGISPDGRTLTYHLMPGARWHDGQPVTAADVIFTWHAIMNPANNAPQRNGYDRIVAMDAPDPHTLRVHFRAPYPPAVYLFQDGQQGAILPAHLLATQHDINHSTFNAAPVGSGPYVFDGWSHGSEMRFRANHAYFRGPPHIERVVLKFLPNQNTLTSQMSTHEIDVDIGVPPLMAQRLQGHDGIALATTSTTHWEHLNFNTGRPPLDERVVRRALCAAIDEQTIFRNFYRGFGRAAPTHFNPDFGWGDPSVAYLPYDPKAAGAMLERAGWKLGADGVRARGATRLAFSLSTVAGVKTREAIEVYLQSAWRAIGAEVTIRNFQAATLFAPYGAGGLLPTGKTDVALYTWEYTSPDPNDEQFIGPNMTPPAGNNESFLRDPEIGRLEDVALSTYDLPTRRRAYRDIARILADLVPEYVLDWEPEITATNVDLIGPGPVPVGSDLWNVADWHFK